MQEIDFYYFSDKNLFIFGTSGILLTASIFCFNQGRLKISLFLLFIGALGLGVFIASLDPFLILWDEQYHALVAKNMMDHPFRPMLYATPLLEYDYRSWTNNHIWLHKQPLFLWEIALSLKIFGCNALAVRIPSVISHAIASLLIFRIGTLVNSQRVGFYGALFFSVAYYPLELVAGKYSTDHNDIAFLFYVLASFWAWFEYRHSGKKRYLILIGLFSGAAVLVKWLVGLLIYSVWIISVGVEDKKKWMRIESYYPILISFLITVIVFLPWQIFSWIQYPLEAAQESRYNQQHFFEAIEDHGGGFWFHFEALKTLYGSGDLIPYIYLLGIIFLLKKTESKTYRVAIAMAVSIVYAFYTIAATKMVSYCIIVSPFVFLGLGSMVDSMLEFVNNKIRRKNVTVILYSIPLLIISLFLLDLRKIQNYHTDWKPNDNCGRDADLAEMKFIEKIKNQLGDGQYVIFNANVSVNCHIPIMFYTDYIAYDVLPTEEQLNRLDILPYTLVVVDDDALPGYILSKSKIIKIKP